mgnify:CR=1 FL=1
MIADLLAWLNLGVRWLHVIAGIAWIGSSFYFMWLDARLKADATTPQGVQGDLWAVHGGGFYHKRKYLSVPPDMPDDLHWFKWEAYTTWISGFLLLSLIFYVGADLNLVDRAKADLEAWQAIAIGLGSLVAGWLLGKLFFNAPLRPLRFADHAEGFVALAVTQSGWRRLQGAGAIWNLGNRS